MKGKRIAAVDLALAAICLAVILAAGWHGFRVVQNSMDMGAIETSLQEQSQALRRLRTVDAVSAPRQELAQVKAQVADSPQATIPPNVDNLALLYGLLGFVPESGVRIISATAQGAQTQSIESVSFQLTGYQIRLAGNPFEMLAMVKRVDENALASLTIPSLTLAKGEQGWTMDVAVIVRLPAASQPAAAPATPTAAPGKASPAATPTGTPAKR